MILVILFCFSLPVFGIFTTNLCFSLTHKGKESQLLLKGDFKPITLLDFTVVPLIYFYKEQFFELPGGLAKKRYDSPAASKVNFQKSETLKSRNLKQKTEFSKSERRNLSKGGIISSLQPVVLFSRS